MNGLSHHGFLQAEFPFVRPRLLLPVLLLWILSTAWLVVRFRALDSDSIMYGLPLTTGAGPFSLFVPLLGDFPPYSTVWGHQWPGSMWLRGALFAVIPFHRWLDISLLLGLQFLAAYLAGKLVWILTRGAAASLCASLIILSDRVLIAGLQLHRFEAITILSLVALLFALVVTAGTPKEQIQNPKSNCNGREATAGLSIPHPKFLLLSFLAAFVAASTHPFGLAISAGLVGIGGLDWLILRRRTARAALIPAAGFLAGVGSLGLYYFLLPDALAQFQQNLALQNSFNDGTRLAFLAHLKYYKVLGFALWAGVWLAIPFVIFRLGRRGEPAARFAAWALPLAALAVPALFTLTRSANNSYAALGTPFAAILVATAVGLVSSRPGRPWRFLVTSVLCLLTVGFLSVYPYRWLVFFRSGSPDFPEAMRELIERVPAGARVYIPPPLWDAARQDPLRSYRLYTLSIASPSERRLAYERKIYGEARPGDILVVDRISGTTGDPWGILPTFETLPPDARYWRPLFEAIKRIPGAGHDFGYDLAVYEFRGVAWDPGETPRKTIQGR